MSITPPPAPTSRQEFSQPRAESVKPIQVNTRTGGQRFSLSAAATSGPAGETAFLAWADDSNAGPDKSGARSKDGR